MHRTLPIVLAANLINASLIIAVFSDRAAPPLLIGWWLLMLAMVAVRGAGWLCHRNRSATEQMHRRWETLSILGSGASGVLWGAAGALFCVPDELYLVVLGFVLGGMGAGALASLTPHIWTFYAYFVPSVLPFTVKLAMFGGTHHWVMVAMCALYLFSRWSSHGVLIRG